MFQFLTVQLMRTRPRGGDVLDGKFQFLTVQLMLRPGNVGLFVLEVFQFLTVQLMPSLVNSLSFMFFVSIPYGSINAGGKCIFVFNKNEVSIPYGSINASVASSCFFLNTGFNSLRFN